MTAAREFSAGPIHAQSTVDNGILYSGHWRFIVKVLGRQFSNTVNLAWYGISAPTDIATPIGSAIAALGTRARISMPRGTLTYYINSQLLSAPKRSRLILAGIPPQVHASFYRKHVLQRRGERSANPENGTLDGNKASFTITGYGINVGAVATAPEIYGSRCKIFPTDATSLFGGGPPSWKIPTQTIMAQVAGLASPLAL